MSYGSMRLLRSNPIDEDPSRAVRVKSGPNARHVGSEHLEMKEREGAEGKATLAARLKWRFRRQTSTPILASQSAERVNPWLQLSKSVDREDQQRGARTPVFDRYSIPALLAAPARRRNRKHLDELLGNALAKSSDSGDSAHSNDLTAGKLPSEDSSRQLNLLWGEDPESKSEIFSSLLQIENTNVVDD